MPQLVGLALILAVIAVVVLLNFAEAKRRAKLTPKARKAEDEETSKPVSGF